MSRSSHSTPRLSVITSWPLLARIAAFAAILGTLGAQATLAQDADLLASRLTTPNVHVRAEAVARLNALPISALTPSARGAMIALLEQEATGQAPVSADTAADGDETYGEYVIDLTSGVMRLQDPAALRGLALLGIQTGRDVQQYVASFGARSLPVLAEAWRLKADARPSVITTWAFSAALTGPNALSKEDRQQVLASILSASDTYPIAVASAARSGSLVILIPVLANIAAHTTDEVISSRAEKAVTILSTQRAGMSPLALFDETAQWVAGFCGGPGSATGIRNGTCVSLRNRLDNAREHIIAGRVGPAVNVLTAIEREATDARLKGALTAAESLLIADNARYVASRL
ncbi:MAG TPA: hypothetical protein VGG84_06465 [Gemmatimonadaceae bacterium]